MPTILSRLMALEPVVKLNGLRIDHAASKQNGRDCWYIATDRQLRRRGIQLPDSWSLKM